ncbi:uncharacterized protein (DUF2384 family) [Caballeronia udeis]|uniref:Uncharacterized protein (DUF2384 family) n=1 Tax=Caballeronia udeis TaxID=1232866 RepID=A0ABW8N1E5_9BURK
MDKITAPNGREVFRVVTESGTTGFIAADVPVGAVEEMLKRLKVAEAQNAIEVAQLLDGHPLLARATRVFGDRNQALRWLMTPQKQLGGQTPLEISLTDDGMRRVQQLLTQIDQGYF